MKPVTKKIPAALYRKFHAVLPLVCADVVVKSGKKFLLLKRANPPEKGKWWFPGGRIYKGERLAQAARRKVKQETGLAPRRVKMLGVYEYFSRVGYFPGMTSHMLPAVFLCEVRGSKSARLDSQSSEYRWFDKIRKNFHPYIKEYLHKAGFRD